MLHSDASLYSPLEDRGSYEDAEQSADEYAHSIRFVGKIHSSSGEVFTSVAETIVFSTLPVLPAAFVVEELLEVGVGVGGGAVGVDGDGNDDVEATTFSGRGLDIAAVLVDNDVAGSQVHADLGGLMSADEEGIEEVADVVFIGPGSSVLNGEADGRSPLGIAAGFHMNVDLIATGEVGELIGE